MGFKYACFISYAHGQNDLVKTFINQLMRALKNYLEPFLDEEIYIDTERLKPGYEYNEALARAICESLCMIVVYSPIYERRDYCLREFSGMEQVEQQRRPLLDQASYGKRFIIPIIFRGDLTTLPQKIKDCIHYCDFSKFTLADPDISRHPEFIPEIEKICRTIKELYDILQQAKGLDQVFQNCVSFHLPTGADVQPLRPALGLVPQAFPGRTRG